MSTRSTEDSFNPRPKGLSASRWAPTVLQQPRLASPVYYENSALPHAPRTAFRWDANNCMTHVEAPRNHPSTYTLAVSSSTPEPKKQEDVTQPSAPEASTNIRRVRKPLDKTEESRSPPSWEPTSISQGGDTQSRSLHPPLHILSGQKVQVYAVPEVTSPLSNEITPQTYEDYTSRVVPPPLCLPSMTKADRMEWTGYHVDEWAREERNKERKVTGFLARDLLNRSRDHSRINQGAGDMKIIPTPNQFNSYQRLPGSFVDNNDDLTSITRPLMTEEHVTFGPPLHGIKIPTGQQSTEASDLWQSSNELNNPNLPLLKSSNRSVRMEEVQEGLAGLGIEASSGEIAGKTREQQERHYSSPPVATDTASAHSMSRNKQIRLQPTPASPVIDHKAAQKLEDINLLKHEQDVVKKALMVKCEEVTELCLRSRMVAEAIEEMEKAAGQK
jgi:hypothetical protein